MNTYVIAADIGGTTIKLGLFSSQGTLLEQWEIPTHTEDNGSAILPETAASVTAKLAERAIPHCQVLGIGLCVPGPVDPRGVVDHCVNLGWGVTDLRQQIRTLLPDIPRITAGNDANAAALGALWQGSKNRRSAVLFTLGTGIGGGVVLDGRILSGSNGSAGEVGHITVEPQETALCSCGKRGCLEQYASARGIVRMTRDMLANSALPSALRTLPDFTAREIWALAQNGDVAACAATGRWSEYMGRAMSSVACVIDPDVFLIGGGMSRVGTYLVDCIRPHYRRYAFHASREIPIEIAPLGSDAGIYGCARMVLNP